MIESPSNPTVKLLKSLATARGRREHGLFMAEGVRLVEDGLESGATPRICLYDAEHLERTERGRHLARRLRDLQAGGSNVQEASERALSAVSDTLHPQGIVCAFPTQLQAPRSGNAGGCPLVLICDGIHDPGNLGTMLRTAEAAGVTEVWLAPDCVDAYSPKVVRAAMGAHFRLPVKQDVQWSEIEGQLAALAIGQERLFATGAGEGPDYTAVDWRSPAALIISNEAHGLSHPARELAAKAGKLISIPMAGQTESLNAAVAAAVILFEAARQRRAT